MTSRARRSALGLVATLALCAAAPAAQAQGAYPNRAIKFIIPYVAGSAADLLSRMLATQLGTQMGVAVVPENRLGAGATIGTAEMARAAPDGYTLGMGAQASLINNMVLYAKPGYDSAKDFTPLGLIADLQNVLVVAPGSKYAKAEDLLADIKAKPAEQFKYSSSGVGTSHHMAGAVLAQFLDKPMMHVPFTGAPQGMSAIISGDVDLGLYNIPAAMGLIRGGKLKPLAVTALRRSELLPNIPTLDEAGLKKYEVTLWYCLLAPRGLPADITRRINTELAKALATPEFSKRLTEQGFSVYAEPGSPADNQKLIMSDLEKWPPIIRKLGPTGN
jgi:tripartite-type tricarboxylate transporter receptor subunit TctC